MSYKSFLEKRTIFFKGVERPMMEIFIRHLPEDDVDAWSRRDSVKNLIGLIGAQLDLQLECRSIDNKANKMFTKLKIKMYPKQNQCI